MFDLVNLKKPGLFQNFKVYIKYFIHNNFNLNKLMQTTVFWSHQTKKNKQKKYFKNKYNFLLSTSLIKLILENKRFISTMTILVKTQSELQ